MNTKNKDILKFNKIIKKTTNEVKREVTTQVFQDDIKNLTCVLLDIKIVFNLIFKIINLVFIIIFINKSIFLVF